MKLFFQLLLFRYNCPVCRTQMNIDMFSPLAQNITEILGIPCIFMNKGCSIKLKKSEILEHEKEQCRYRELMCPGCKEKCQAWKLPDHFVICRQLIYQDYWQCVELDEMTDFQYIVPNMTTLDVFRPVVFKLKNCGNWFLLCADMLEDKLVFYVKHYSREETKEIFYFNLKVFTEKQMFSRSMSGLCTSFDMEITDARTRGYTLDISVKAMENIISTTDKNEKYVFKVELSLLNLKFGDGDGPNLCSVKSKC